MTAPLPEDLPWPQTAIVTGSDSGIGRSVAVALAGGGLDVGITWHEDAEGAERTADELGGVDVLVNRRPARCCQTAPGGRSVRRARTAGTRPA